MSRLNEHAAGTAARVIDPTFYAACFVGERLQHFGEYPHNRARRVELPAALAFGACKAAKEILVDAAEDVFGFLAFLVHGDAAHEIYKLAEHDLVQGGPVVVLGKNAFEAGVFSLDRKHGVVDQLADGGLLGFRL